MRKFISIMKYTGAILSFTALMMAVPSCQQEELEDPAFSIEGEASSYNVPFDGNTASNATRFTIRSNQNWEIVPVEEYDWVRPFPDRGENDGYFTFLVEENFTASEREAYFKMLVDGVEQPTLFTVTQETRGEYIDLKETSFVVTYESSTLKIAMEANVELELSCISDDSGADGVWLTMAPEAEQIEDTLVLKVAESALPSPRNGVFSVQKKGSPDVAQEITVMQTGTQELYGLPAVWEFYQRQTEPEYVASFEENNKMEVANKEDNGLGYLSYIEGENKPDNDKFTRVIGGGGDPYVTGAWPDDYWLFDVPAVVPANTVFNISFVTRVSATGHKFWMLEYLDGGEWLPAGEVKTTNETGSEIEYTAALPSAENLTVNTNFKVVNPSTSLQVRFRCVANWQASGAGALSAPNGGTSRLTGDDQAVARISVVATGVGDEAEITTPDLEGDFVVLEGSGEAVNFTVNATENWNLSAGENSAWLNFTPENGSAGEDVTVSVSADPNETGATRRAVLTITAGMSAKSITVIQGAAGAVLEPLISIVGGNSVDVFSKASEVSVNVQANVPVSVDEASLPEWIEYKPGVETKSLVEVSTFNFGISDNISKDPRSGQIRFFNEEYNLESVLTVSQSEFTWFEDDFSWMNPYIQYYEEQAGKKLGRSVEDNDPNGNAPNVYTTESLSGMVNKFFELGYVDLNPEPHVLYPQNNYWKFGKTGNNTGIMLPPLDGMDTPSDVILTFNWSCHRRVLNAGKENEKYETDPVNIVVEVVKDVVMGTASEGEPMVTSSTVVYTSEEFVSEQTPYTMEWQSVSIRLDGISKDTRIQIRPSNMSPDSKAVNRWYIDNIKISPAE